jgi:hypothetical protein
MHSGIKLQEQRDSSGLLTILNTAFLCKKLEPEYITNFNNLGGAKYQKNIGVKLKSK